MNHRGSDSIASRLADGEAPPELAARRDEPAIQSELLEIERLSLLLRVPEDVAQPDPFFVARFRARRDAVRSSDRAADTWRRMTLRLLPLAVCALLAALLVVGSSGDRTSALGELEMTDLGNGVGDVTLESTSVEPVLRIALGEL
jgi:hypothetical protein